MHDIADHMEVAGFMVLILSGMAFAIVIAATTLGLYLSAVEVRSGLMVDDAQATSLDTTNATYWIITISTIIGSLSTVRYIDLPSDKAIVHPTLYRSSASRMEIGDWRVSREATSPH